MDNKYNSRNAATRRRLRGLHVSSLLSCILIAALSTCVRSTGTLLPTVSSPFTFMKLPRQPKVLLVLDMSTDSQQTKVTKTELKARSDAPGPCQSYIPRPTLSMMGQSREGEGGPPTPSHPSRGHPMLCLVIGPFPPPT